MPFAFERTYLSAHFVHFQANDPDLAKHVDCLRLGATAMPFKSQKQRRYLHANEPEVAKQFERDAKKKGTPPVQPKKTPPQKKKP